MGNGTKSKKAALVDGLIKKIMSARLTEAERKQIEHMAQALAHRRTNGKRQHK